MIDVKKEKLSSSQKFYYGIKFFLKYAPDLSVTRYNLDKCGEEYHTYIKAFKQYRGKNILLWENTHNHVTPYISKGQNFKLIALPHNLESLVHLQTRMSLQLNGLRTEGQHLAMADKIFCISREEQWLLALMGIQAEFLPYFPTESVVAELRKIREIRKTSRQDRYLILGTAYNPPTLSGMIEQIEWLKMMEASPEISVEVVGYGTEKLKNHVQGTSIKIIGSATPEALHDRLVRAKAILVHQKNGVGALTRIPEMLIAGIPVISNAVGARSAHNYSGVYCYDDISELSDLLSADIQPPDELPRPSNQEEQFIRYLQRL